MNSGRRTADGEERRKGAAGTVPTPGVGPAIACLLARCGPAVAGPSDRQLSTVNRQLGSSWRLLVLAPLLLAASACGNIEPWVKPYERQALADPIMSFDPHPVSSSYMHHVFEAREGARGAQGGGGGGCGCN